MSYFSNKSQEGLEAFKSGLRLNDNPYPEGTTKFWQWFCGYRTGQAFHERSLTAKAISELTRLAPDRWTRKMMIEDERGEYVKFSDVVALFKENEGK